MLVSKYLQKDRTPLFNLDAWKRYTFKGTYNGTEIMYNKSQAYDPIKHVYHEVFIPVSSFTHVKVMKGGKVVSKMTRLMMQFRTALSNANLRRGDQVSFTAKVRKYTKGGRFTGDLLSVIKDATDATGHFNFKSSQDLKRSNVMAHLLWDNSNPYNFAYLSWQSPLIMSKAIFNYYHWNADILKAIKSNGSLVYNEAKAIVSLLDSTPFQYAINGNNKTESIYINCDGNTCDISNKTPYQIIKPLNDKAHLITPSKMEKLKDSYNPIANFYILLKGIHRAIN